MADTASIWPAIIQAVSVSVSAIAVAMSAAAWTRSAVGKRRVEIAEEALTALYGAEHAMRRIRNPASFGYEHDEVKKELEVAGQAVPGNLSPYVTLLRLGNEHGTFAKLESAEHLCRAYFGAKVAAPFDEVRDVYGRVRIAARMLINLRSRTPSDRNLDQCEKWEAAIWLVPSDSSPDPLEKQMTDAVTKANAFFRPILEHRNPFAVAGTRAWKAFLRKVRSTA